MVQTPRLISRSVSSMSGSSMPPLPLTSLIFAANSLAKPNFSRELVHDHVIGARLEHRVDHLLAPLDRAVGCGGRAGAFHLRRRRQQVDAVLAHHRRHRRGRRRIRVDHHQQVELLHRLDHFLAARSGCSGAWPQKTTARRFESWSMILVLLQHRVDPARYRDARLFHHRRRSKLLLQPVVDPRPTPGRSAPTNPARCRNSPAANRGWGRRRSRPARCRGRGRCCSRRRRCRRCPARAAGCRTRGRSRCRWCAGSAPSPTRWCWAGSSPSSRRRRALRLPSCR